MYSIPNKLIESAYHHYGQETGLSMEEFANQVANKPKKELYGLADMLYNDFYSNSMDREDFDNRIGWAEWEAEQPNWAEIVGSRVADRATKLVGGGVEAVDSVLDAAEFIGSFNPQLLTQDKQEIKDQTRERLNRPSKLDEVATSIRQHEFKYENERGTSWDQLVESPFKSFAPFAIEEGIVSLPDMLAALANLPAYAIARTGEIAGERADNDIREDSTVGDFLAALPSAVASAALEKIGASKVFGITDDLAKSSLKPDADKLDVALDVGKRTASAIGRRAAAEGLTEAAQEPIEQIGASLGTERWKNKSSEEIFAELNQAAVQGGVTGALAGGGIASTQVAVEEYLNQRRNQVDKNKIDEEESASQAQNQNNNNVSTEPAMEGDFIYGGQGETRPERLLGSGQTTGQSDSVPPSSDGFVVTPEGETMTRGEFEEKQNAWKRPPSFLDTVEEDQRNVSSILMEQLAQKGKIEIVDPKSLQDGQSVVIDFGYDNPRKVTVRKRSNSVFEIIDETGRTLAPTISTKQQDSQKNPMLYSSTIKEYQAQAKSEDKEFNEMTPEMREEGMEMARLIKNFANNRDRATLEAIRKLRNSKNFNKMPEESRDIIDGLLRDGDKIFEDEIKAEKEKKEKEAKAAQEAKEKEAQEAKDAELAAERETVNIGEDIEVAWDNNLYLFVGRHKPSGKVFSTGRKRDSVLKAATDLANDPEAIDKVVKSTQKPAPTSKPKAEPKAEPKPKTASETFQENYRQLQTNFSAKPTKENFDAIDKLSADFDWTTVTEDEFNKVNDFLVANRPTFYPPDDTVDEGETEDQTQVDTSPQGILQTAKNLNSVIEDLDNTEIGSIENDEAAEQLESFIGSKEFSTLPDNVQTEIKAYSETGSGSIRSLYNLLEGKSPEDQPVVDDSVSNDKPIPSQQTRSEQKASKEQAEAIKAGKIGPRPPTMSGPGKKAVLLTHDEKKWKGKFALVSANDLLASTNTSGQLTPDYPEMLQPRNRADKQSLLQMSKIANKPNPLRLGDTNMASEGAPVVRSDGVVLSGNGRTAGLKEAYIKGNADKYKKWVLKQAKKFGINAKDIIKAGDMPVLVRVLGDYSIQEQLAFARDANESTILKESAGSQASIDAARIADANIIHLYAPSQKGEMNTASNRMFIGRALTAINRTDAVGNDGQITPEGERILNSAVFHMAYGDDRLTKMLAEETRPQNANIIKALRIVAGDFAKARAESPDFDGIDIAGALTEGIEIIQQAASRNLQVEEFLAQEDAFSEQLGYTPAGKLMANFMYENRLSAKKMIDAFGTMGKLLNEALAEKNQIQMPGLEPIQHTVESIIQATALRILETNEAGSESLSSGLSGAGSMFSDEDLQDSDTAMQEADASAFDLSASGSVQSTDQAEDTSPRPTKPLFQKKQVTTKDFWQEQAKSIYNKWNNSKSVKDSIENIIKNLAPWANIREMSEEFAEIADGAFDIIGGQAYIFYNLTAKNPTHSMHHEILHALREARLFTNEEWSKLSEMAVKEWIAKHNIEDRYPELFDDNGKPTEAAIEEAIAEEFADYAIKHLQKNNAIKKTFGKLFNFNTDMMKLLRGLGAVPETDAIFDKILSGEVTARHPSMQTKDVPVKNIPNPLKIKLTHNLSTQYLEKQIDEGFVAPSISIQMQNDANFFGLNKEDKHNDMYAAATVVFKPTALSWGQDPVFPGDAYTPMRGGSWDAFSYDEVAKRGLPNFLGDQRKVDLISMASDVYNMSISDNSIKKSEDGNFYFNTVNEKNKKTRRKVTDKNFNDVIIQAARDMIGLKSYNHLWEGLGRGQIRTIEQSKQVLATIANFGEEKSRVRGGVFLEAKPLKIIPATEVSYVVIGEKDYLMDDNDYKRMIDKLKRKGIDVVMAKDVDSLGAAQSRDDVLFQRMRQSFLPKLRAVHSIAEHKIIKSLQYEGLPAPSIAITPENVAHQWGDEKIDLVFKAGTVVPSRDDIATGDSWSVTHPTTQLMMAGTNAQKKAFIENVMKEAKKIPRKNLSDIGKYFINNPESALTNGYGQFNVGNIYNLIDDIYFNQLGLNNKTSPLTELQKAHHSQDPFWKIDFLKSASGGLVKEYIWTGSDNMGRPIYKEATAKNIVRVMKQDLDSSNEYLSATQLAGKVSPRIRTMKELRERAKNVVGRQTENKQDAGFERDRVSNIENVLNDYIQFGGYQSFDTLMQEIINKGGDVSKAIKTFENEEELASINSWLDKVANDNSLLKNENVADWITAKMQEIYEGELAYLEAKPMRVIPWKNVSAAIVPSNTSSRVVKMLQEKGIDIIEKDGTETPEELAEMQSSPEGVKFQRAKRERTRSFPFFSGLARRLATPEFAKKHGWIPTESKPNPTRPAKTILSMLRSEAKSGGDVTEAEMRWTAIDDVLKSDPNKAYSLDNLIELVEEGGVNIKLTEEDKIPKSLNQKEEYLEYVSKGSKFTNYEAHLVFLPRFYEDWTEATYKNYEHNHWPYNNVFGWLRTTHRNDGKTLFIDEMQSDWISEYKNTIEAANRLFSESNSLADEREKSIAADRVEMEKLADRLVPISVSKEELQEFSENATKYPEELINLIQGVPGGARHLNKYSKYFRAYDPNSVFVDYANYLSKLNTDLAYVKNSREGAQRAQDVIKNIQSSGREFSVPFNKDQFITMMLKRALALAVEKDMEYIAWPSSQMMQDTQLSTSDYAYQYDKKMVSQTRKMLGVSPMYLTVSTMEKAKKSDPKYRNAWYFKIPDGVRSQVKKVGLPLYGSAKLIQPRSKPKKAPKKEQEVSPQTTMKFQKRQEDPPHKFSGPKGEKRDKAFKENARRLKTGLLDTIKVAKDGVIEMLTRSRKEIPNDRKSQQQYAEINERMYHLEMSSEYVLERVKFYLNNVVGNLNENDLMAITKKFVLDDLLYTKQAGMETPQDLDYETEEEILADLQDIESYINERPHLLAAVENRKNQMKAVTYEMVNVGVLTRQQAQNPNYFRHVVLEYQMAKLKSGAGGSNKVKTGYWHTRRGSGKSISTDYVYAETEWLYKAFNEIGVANFLNWLRNSDHNKANEIVNRAKAENQTALDAMVQNDPELESKLRNRRKDITKAMEDLRDEVLENMDLVFQFVDESLHDNLREFSRTAYVRAAQGQYDGVSGVWRLMMALAHPDMNENIRRKAQTALNTVGRKKAFIRDTLGSKYTDPANLENLIEKYLSEGDISYSTWQPDARRANEKAMRFYTIRAITESTMNRYMDNYEELLKAGGMSDRDYSGLKDILQDMMRTYQIKGGLMEQFVLDDNIASALNEFYDPAVENVVDRMVVAMTGSWKFWTLFNPGGIIRYNLNNITSDTEKQIMAGILRSSWKEFREADRMVRDMMDGKSIDPVLQKALEYGVIQSTLTVQDALEMGPDISKFVEKFGAIEKAKRWADVPKQVFARYFDFVTKWTRYRESVYRLMAFMAYRKQLGNEELSIDDVAKKTNFGAVPPEVISGLLDKGNRDILAARMARSAIGDYGMIPVAAKKLRLRLLPFLSFSASNIITISNEIRNAFLLGQYQKAAGRAGAGTAIAGAMILMRMLYMYGFVQLWNNFMFEDQEKRYSPEMRNRLHLNLGCWGDDQMCYSIRFAGSFSDFASFFGAEDAGALMGEVIEGRASMAQVLKSVPKATVNRTAGMISPTIKLPVELASGQDFYPDVFRPRGIQNKTTHIAETLSVETPVAYTARALGIPFPTRKPWQSILGALVQVSDPGEQSYYTVQAMGYDFLAMKTGNRGSFGGGGEKGWLMHSLRRAVRMGDEKVAGMARAKLYQLGEYDMHKILKRSPPLGMLNKQQKRELLMTFDAWDRRNLLEAEQWHRMTSYGGY